MTLIDLDQSRGPASASGSTDARWSATGPITLGRAVVPGHSYDAGYHPQVQTASGSGPYTGGLTDLDRCILACEERGLRYVEGPAEELAALERHLVRRARTAGRPVVSAGGLPTADAWREIARKLGVAATLDPRAAAREMVARAGNAVLLVLEGTPGLWGRTVAATLEGETDAGCLVLVLTERAPAVTSARGFEVGAELGPRAARVWFEAIVSDPDEPTVPAHGGLADLEAWWAAARATPSSARAAGPTLDAAERQLLDRLALSQRSWSEPEAARLGSPEALLRLQVRGILAVDGCDRVVAGPRHPVTGGSGSGGSGRAAVVSLADAAAVADLLEEAAGDDPWSLARAGELHAVAGAGTRAEQAMARALSLAAEASLREDLWQRHDALLCTAPAGELAARRLAAAERALSLGDVDRALDFARQAAAEQGDSFAAMWTLGRAASARGDLTTAEIALDKARTKAPDDTARVRVAVERADLRYQVGAFDEARTLAEEGLVADGALRLAARNVLGKILLARGAFAEAEQHFAADAHDAACCGDAPSELRARLNRGIALLMMQRQDEARALFLTVVEDGERWGDARAIERGLHNLAVAAHRRQDYGDALQRYTEALNVATRLGEKLPIVTLILGRAELSVCLNLLAEAEQALAFGRRTCGPGIPGSLVMGFEIVGARIHLAGGHTEEAAAAVRAALRCAGSAHVGDRVDECDLVLARIALEEGDLAQAEQAIARAAAAPSGPRARAETALLEALLARAAGAPFTDKALAALDLARQSESLDLVLETHLLLARSHSDAGKPTLARGNLSAATEIKDRMARGLPDDVRARFLQRRDLVELTSLEAAVSAQREVVVPASVPRERPAPESEPTRRIVGNAPGIIALRSAIQRIAAAEGTVLIRGESGTGKELVATAVHDASARRRGPLLKVNCAALSESLLQSELFGHEKGAFTGATARRQGRFELADGGTIFLDEIGDISPVVQKNLLRVLQERTFERVGSAASLRTDCRVICATHRDLHAMVARGEFREDLYYRLHGLVLQVPALRKRAGDLPLLAATILRRIATERGAPPKQLSSSALVGLARHPWPGNVRELENALLTAVTFAEGSVIELEDFTRNVETLRYLAGEEPEAPVAEDPAVTTAAAAPAGVVLDDAAALVDATYAYVRAGVPLGDAKRWVERECITRALAETGGNITRAAERLGMKRSRLSQIVKQYALGTTEEDES